ncbi:DoxX family protein [Streptomyces sp. NPDC003362]
MLGQASAPLGVAAAVGLALLMAAAAVVHLRHGDPLVRVLPAAFPALAAVAHAGVAAAAGDGLGCAPSRAGGSSTPDDSRASRAA